MLGEYLRALFRTFGEVIGLSPDALDAAGVFGWAVPAGIAVIGGVSIMVGQSIVLAINRVTRLRGTLTLLTAGLGVLAIGTMEALMASLATMLLMDSPFHFSDLLPSVLVSYAPYWFSALVLLPYTGPGIQRLLNVWHLAAMWTLLVPVLDAGRSAALAVAASAWLTTMLLDWAIERSPLRLRERVFNLVSGSKGLTGRDVLASAKWGSGQ